MPPKACISDQRETDILRNLKVYLPFERYGFFILQLALEVKASFFLSYFYQEEVALFQSCSVIPFNHVFDMTDIW